MILIVKHVSNEGPGLLGEVLNSEGFEIKEIELSRGDKLPGSLDAVEAVISMGGPMNVYEEAKYPFLKDEDTYIKKVINNRVPFLGVCLGGQLLAKAAGAKVKAAPVQEIGWQELILGEYAAEDPLFNGVNSRLKVFQWHGDMFEIPENGKALIRNEVCNQAFSVNRTAYGLQFHIEVTKDIIKSWFEDSWPLYCGETQGDYDNYIEQSTMIIRNFASLCKPFHK